MNAKIKFLFLLLTICIFSNANGWELPFKNSKCFIENKGQFQSSMLQPGERILYAYDEGNTKVYFTNKGVIYSFIESRKSENIFFEKRQGGKLFFNTVEEYKEFEREEFKHELEIENVHVEWLGCNNAAMIIAEENTNEHFSYSYYDKEALKSVNNLKGVKKITYKSIYPGVDLEYVLHEKGGLKYSLILQPGASLSDFKMLCNKPVLINEKGQTIIFTKFGEIVEHAPICFYSDNKKEIIPSTFVANNGILQFQLNNFNAARIVVIDPWVQLPVLTNSNSVWECERDTLGNVYTIGGDMPMKLQKYDPSGTLLWTFSTPFDTTSWLGSMITDAIGNTYISQGSEAKIMKVDANGNFLWINTPVPLLSHAIEYWSFTFNFDQSRLFVGGTDLKMSPFTMHGKLYEIDTANGQQLNSQILSKAVAVASPSEIRAIEMAPNGRLYSLTHDSIFRSEQNFDTTSVIAVNSGQHLSYKCENWRYINSGIEAIRANENYLYVHRGNYLTRRSLQNNSLIDSVLIPAGSVSIGPILGYKIVGASGIDIDKCGNVYVGAVNAVVKFDSTLTFVDSIQVPFTVFDLSINLGGEVIAVGSTTQTSGVRTGYIASLDLLACEGLDNIHCEGKITGNVSSVANG
ncbi:MAG: hypothetical protein L6Q66_09100, partial [Bacteroidia bacterium]|nr:hypothetical protein [Bacteroidia bacterium]